MRAARATRAALSLSPAGQTPARDSGRKKGSPAAPTRAAEIPTNKKQKGSYNPPVAATRGHQRRRKPRSAALRTAEKVSRPSGGPPLPAAAPPAAAAGAPPIPAYITVLDPADPIQQAELELESELPELVKQGIARAKEGKPVSTLKLARLMLKESINRRANKDTSRVTVLGRIVPLWLIAAAPFTPLEEGMLEGALELCRRRGASTAPPPVPLAQLATPWRNPIAEAEAAEAKPAAAPPRAKQ